MNQRKNEFENVQAIESYVSSNKLVDTFNYQSVLKLLDDNGFGYGIVLLGSPVLSYADPDIEQAEPVEPVESMQAVSIAVFKQYGVWMTFKPQFSDLGLAIARILNYEKEQG